MELYIYSTSLPSWPVIEWNLPFYLFSLLHRACCRVTQLLHQPLHIHKIYKIFYTIYTLMFNVLMCKFYKFYICAVVGIIIELLCTFTCISFEHSLELLISHWGPWQQYCQQLPLWVQKLGGGDRIVWKPTNHKTSESCNFAVALSQGGNCKECRSSLRLSNLFVIESPNVAKTTQRLLLWHVTFVSTQVSQEPDLTDFNLKGQAVPVGKCHKWSYSDTHSYTLH